jgi:glycosidase
MNREAILHIPLSNYAYGLDETHVVFRLRTARNDIKSCILHYGDRSCRETPVIFTPITMKIASSDDLFDYYEIKLSSPYTRICYYFELSDGKTTCLYYSDEFHSETTRERSEYYQFPFNRREDIAQVPKWVNDEVVYNIFPDSFATGRRYIAKEGMRRVYRGNSISSKNGGTICGIIDNLDYLTTLGINCIYLNPIFVAGEYHKYDLLDYFHIDPCFGTDDDFRKLVTECHKNHIRVIIDGVFNHCGWNFFAFDDVAKNGEKSTYKDWFYNLTFPVIRPDNMNDYPNYSCFGYERTMPKLNTSNPEVIHYFMKVCRYWLESFDIDGWRLDAANEINFDFWRMFRKTAKSVKPDCLLIGEIWESAYPWLRGDQFDSSMNYDMRKNCRDFFASGRIDAAGFEDRVTKMIMRYPQQMLYAQLNVLDTHDVSRFLTLCEGNWMKFRLAVVFQMTFVGMPSIFYGDEQGIQGLTENEYRQPMVWENKRFFEFYRILIHLRRSNIALRQGSLHTICAEKGKRLYIFERVCEAQSILVALNAGDRKEVISVLGGDEYNKCLFQEGMSGKEIEPWGFGMFEKLNGKA